MSISIPVNVFEPKTLLERVAEDFLYAPIFLEQASLCGDPLSTFKYAITFGISILHLCTEQRKPFNPILGETFQANIGGCPFMAEQTSHHPPIAHFTLKGKGYEIQGAHEFFASTSANSVKARQKGMTKIIFNQGNSIVFSYPMISIAGTIMGKRVFNYMGVMTIMDMANGYF